MTHADAIRFWTKVNLTDGCWRWTASIVGNGYGGFYLAGRMARAHRVAWELSNGRPVPDGLDVLHKCDVPNCVNPDHLFLGTHRDNLQDAARKGRLTHHRRWSPDKLRTHCPNGHEFTEANTARYRTKSGGAFRVCKECKKRANAKRISPRGDDGARNRAKTAKQKQMTGASRFAV